MNKPLRAPAWRKPRGGLSFLRLGLIFRLPLALYAFCLLVSFKVVWQVGAHGLRKRHRLRDEVLMVARLAIIVRPTVYGRSEEHTSELQSRENLVCRLLLEK